MDAISLSNYFDEWLKEKEAHNLIQNVYGVNGLMAVINFIEYINYEERNINANKFNRECCERN